MITVTGGLPIPGTPHSIQIIPRRKARDGKGWHIETVDAM